MAETTTTAVNAAETTAATEGQATQQAAEQTTQPTAEQRTAFQRFFDSLLGGGKEEQGDGAEKGGEAAEEGEKAQAEAGKTYTEADLEAKLAEAKKTWETEQQEQQRLEALSPADRAKAERAAQEKELSKLRSELLQRDLKEAAVKKLTDEGFPVGLADLLSYTDKESMETSLQRTQEVFKGALEAAVKERLKGKAPEGLGGGAKAENAVKDLIAKNIRGGLN